MRYLTLLLLIFFLSSVVIAQEYPEPDFPDILPPDEIPVQDVESEVSGGVNFIAQFTDTLPLVQWNSQLLGVKERMEQNQVYTRPQLVQNTADIFGFVWWLHVNREALLGSFAPIYYNLLLFVGWVLLYIVFYISTVVAITIRRIIQDFMGAAMRILSAFLPF